MTQLTVELTAQIHREALDFAESAGKQELPPGVLGKANFEKIMSHIGPLWEEIRIAIEQTVSNGKEVFSELWKNISEKVYKLANETGEAFEDLSRALQERVGAYMKQLEKSMLNTVDALIEVGGVTLNLQSVDIQKSINLGGSLKASLSAAMTLAAGGEMTIKANYATTPS